MRAATTRVERARLRYLFVGALVAVALSIADMLPRLGLPSPAARSTHDGRGAREAPRRAARPRRSMGARERGRV